MPVVPGEIEADWQTHRRGIIDSLAPTGLLEVTMAERVALLLWRLARLAKFEAVNTAYAMQEVGLPHPDADPTPYMDRHRNNDNQFVHAEQELRGQTEALSSARVAADLLRRVLAGGGDPLPATVAQALLGDACGLASGCPSRLVQPLWHTDRAFLDRIGIPPDRPANAAWPPDRLLAALDEYAGVTARAADEFRAELLRRFDRRAALLACGMRRREAEVAALHRRLDAELERSASTALVPPDAAVDRIVKYEKHLHAQLTSTLHELERLQARRGGALVPPPAVADLHVIVNGD